MQCAKNSLSPSHSLQFDFETTFFFFFFFCVDSSTVSVVAHLVRLTSQKAFSLSLSRSRFSRRYLNLSSLGRE